MDVSSTQGLSNFQRQVATYEVLIIFCSHKLVDEIEEFLGFPKCFGQHPGFSGSILDLLAHQTTQLFQVFVGDLPTFSSRRLPTLVWSAAGREERAIHDGHMVEWESNWILDYRFVPTRRICPSAKWTISHHASYWRPWSMLTAVNKSVERLVFYLRLKHGFATW